MDSSNISLIELLSSIINDRTNQLENIDIRPYIARFQKHGIYNLLYYAKPRLSVDSEYEVEVMNALKKASYASAVRNAIQDREMAELSSSFSNNGVKLLPLKGYVIKQLFPLPEMRHMSDTDILIDVIQAEQVKACLESIGFKCNRFNQGSTDIYISPAGMLYEVHRSLEEEGFNKQSCKFLSKLLSFAVPSEDNEFFLHLPYEEHYAYILCHFVKHLLSGGIGVRQVMDIYLCRKKWVFDEEKLAKLLAELELTEFAATIEKLANHWFGGGEGDAVTEELGEYILGSGVFGKEEQKVADRMLKEEEKQSKFSYVLSRLFPSYKTMCFYYPVLKKWAVLLPVFWVWRMIYALIFRRDKLKREVSTVSETDRDAVAQRALFYRRCGLNVYPEYDGKA